MPRKFATVAERQEWERVTLAYLGDLEQSVRDRQLYCQLSSDALIRAVDAALPKTAYRLFLFLCAIFPFSGHRYQMPTQAELALRLGVTRKAVNVAQGQIEDAGLWQFWIKRWDGQNLASTRADGAELPVTPNNRNDAPGNQKVTPVDQKVTPQPLESIDTNSYSGSLDLYRSDLDPFKREKDSNIQTFEHSESGQQRSAEQQNLSVDQLSQSDCQQSSAALPVGFENLQHDWQLSDYQTLSGYQWEQFNKPRPRTFFADFFQTVVHKTSKLPEKPADAHCAAEGWIRKQGEVLWGQYLLFQHQQSIVQATVDAAPQPLQQPVAAPQQPIVSAEDRRQRYLRTWEQAPVTRAGIKRQVEQSPELLLAVRGQQLIDVSQQFEQCAQLAATDRWRLIDRLRTLQADGLNSAVISWVQNNDWGVQVEGQSLEVLDTEKEYSYADA